MRRSYVVDGAGVVHTERPGVLRPARGAGGATDCGVDFVPRHGDWSRDPRTVRLRGKTHCRTCVDVVLGKRRPNTR